jgi:hypothetical protein
MEFNSTRLPDEQIYVNGSLEVSLSLGAFAAFALSLRTLRLKAFSREPSEENL